MELDGRAAVHDHRQVPFGADAGALPVDDAELEPQGTGTDGDRLTGDLLGRVGATEDVDDVDRACASGRSLSGGGGTG